MKIKNLKFLMFHKSYSHNTNIKSLPPLPSMQVENINKYLNIVADQKNAKKQLDILNNISENLSQFKSRYSFRSHLEIIKSKYTQSLITLIFSDINDEEIHHNIKECSTMLRDLYLGELPEDFVATIRDAAILKQKAKTFEDLQLWLKSIDDPHVHRGEYENFLQCVVRHRSALEKMFPENIDALDKLLEHAKAVYAESSENLEDEKSSTYSC